MGLDSYNQTLKFKPDALQILPNLNFSYRSNYLDAIAHLELE